MQKFQFLSGRFQLACAVVASLATCPMANASFTWSGSVGGSPAGANFVNFDNLPLGPTGGSSGGVSVGFTPDGQAVQGYLVNMYAAPYLSGGNGTSFGDPVDGPDTTTYLTTGLGSVTLTFNSPENYFGLLWGSIDAYNTLTFYSGGTPIASLTGTQVLAGANGDQGVNGTLYVNINSSIAFNQVVATSTQYAFEFDNVAYSAVPEPTTMISGALLLLPFGAKSLRFLRKG